MQQKIMLKLKNITSAEKIKQENAADLADYKKLV